MNKKHFTLVEVLVVVGIIGILAGLIFPAVGMARQAGRRTECISNQGQLMKLLTITMQADDNYLVCGGGDALWTRYLYNKGKLQNVKGFRCPAIITDANPNLSTGETDDQFDAALGVVEATGKEGDKNHNGFDFRGTKHLTNGSTPLSPSQLVIGGCSALGDENGLKPKANLLLKDQNQDKDKGFYTVHDGEFNMYFLDGHVETVTPEKAVAGKYIPNNTKGTIIVDNSHIKNYDD